MNKKTIFIKILCNIVGVLIGMFIGSFLLTKSENPDYPCEIYRARVDLHYEGLKDSLVTQVDKYITSIAPNSCVSGLMLVDVCEKYNLDLRFVLAQGHLESHFGTKGIASKTNSVFNVFSYDGLSASQIIKNGHGYKHPDYSIEPYAKLLISKYLIDKTEEDMFIEFKDIHGHRYASDKNYEKKLLEIYNNIDNVVNMGIYNEYSKYKKLLNM